MEMNKQRRIYSVYLLAAVLSLLMTNLSIRYYPVFSSDTMYYLVTAQIFLQQGFHAANAIYSWPWYSILIAGVATVLHLSLLNAAYLLNYVFFAAIAVLFVSIIHNFTDSIPILLVAVVFIVFFRPLNKYSHYLLRDNPYWFLMMLSLYCFIQFMKRPVWWWAISWSIIVFCAGLMRFEGWFFLMLVPVSVFFLSEYKFTARIGRFLQLNLLVIIFVIAALLFFHFGSHQFLKSGRFYNFFVAQFQGSKFIFVAVLSSRSALLAQYVLPSVSTGYAPVMLFFGFLGTYIWLIIFSLSLVHCINLLYCREYKRIIQSRAGLGLCAYIVINLLALLLFSLWSFNFVSRYFQFLSILLMIFAVFGFIHLYQSWRRTWINKVIFFEYKHVGRVWRVRYLPLQLVLSLSNLHAFCLGWLERVSLHHEPSEHPLLLQLFFCQ